MKKFTLLLGAFLTFGCLEQAAVAQGYDRPYVVERGPGYYHHEHYDRARRVYVIENNRPVRRTLFVDGGRYYRIEDDRRIYVEHVFESYPSRYYYRDGRPRVGISINF